MRLRSTEPPTADQSYAAALRLLTGRDYTVSAMRRKLLVRGTDHSDCETVLDRLQREGWLDDSRYAGRFAGAALASGRYYGVRLRMEMRRKGFTSEVIAEALDPLLAEHDEAAEVRVAMKRRYPGFSYGAADDRERRRVVGFLQRRGFGLSVIFRALRAEE